MSLVSYLKNISRHARRAASRSPVAITGVEPEWIAINEMNRAGARRAGRTAAQQNESVDGICLRLTRAL